MSLSKTLGTDHLISPVHLDLALSSYRAHKASRSRKNQVLEFSLQYQADLNNTTLAHC